MFKPSRSLMWLLACGALPIMTTAILSPSLTGLHEAFRGEQEIAILAKLALTTPALAIAFGAGGVGFLLDRWGRRPVMALSLLLFGCSGLQGLWADDIYSLIAFRFIFGLGVAGIMTATATLLADRFEGGALRRVLGLQAASMGAWGIMSQLLAGRLAEYDWRGPFVLYAIALPLLLPLYWLGRPQVAQEFGSEGGTAIRPFRENLFFLPLLALLAFLAMSLFSLLLIHGPFYFHEVVGIGPRGTAWLISCLTAASSLSSLGLAVVKRHLRSSTIISLGFASMAGGLLLLGLWPQKWALVAGMMMVGAGIGSIMPSINAWAAQTVRMRHRGRILGFLTTIIYLGQFLSPIWSEMVLASAQDQGLFMLSAGLALAAAACILLLRLKAGILGEVSPIHHELRPRASEERERSA